MPSGVDVIRGRWFKATPADKRGITERYVVFGEVRKWMVSQLNLPSEASVLDLGFGHGFLSFELASLTKTRISAIDFLKDDQVNTARNGARIGRLDDRISWIVADARSMPFLGDSFDAVVSFNALQDVCMTGGTDALTGVLEESCRVLRPGGTLALADNMFPECVQNEGQGLWWKIQTEEFGATLPSENVATRKLAESGIIGLVEHHYDARIEMDDTEARVELADIVDAKPFGRVFDFEKLWNKYEGSIKKTKPSYPSVLLLSGKKRFGIPC